jgi:simple sugar transport system substrate-binding protein
MNNRADFLRRTGIGAAGVSLGQLLGPAAAFAADGGGDFAAHPRWRFVFVSHDTLDPLFVATQFGAQDAASLVNCSVQWTGSPRGNVKETVQALHTAISRKADGIAVSILDQGAFRAELDSAAAAKIPVIAFNVESGSGRLPYVGENPYASGVRVGSEIARLVPRGRVLIFAPLRSNDSPVAERRLKGLQAGLARGAGQREATVVRLKPGSPRNRQQEAVESAVARFPAVRGLFAVDGAGTLAVGSAIESLGLSAKGVRGGGYDLLPGDLDLVTDGQLDFVIDQQPYVQGFTPVLQLFLTKVSEGTVLLWDTETSVLLRAADVQRFVATKSRFEGSSSRHDYPLRRA